MDTVRDMESDEPGLNTPLLDSIGKNNPFSVPEGYFDALPAQIIAHCKGGEKRLPLVNYDKIFVLFKPRFMALSFVAIIGICLLLRGGGSHTDYAQIESSIPDSLLTAAVQKNLEYVDESALADMVAEQGGITNQAMLDEQPVQDSTGKQIINYLMNNNIDATDIENAL